MAYTNIDDPSAYFQAATYTGNGTDNTAITYDGNSDMQPDFLWFKLRSTTGNHVLFDSNRGVTKYVRSNNNAAETANATLLKSFDTDGFTVGTAGNTNSNGNTLVSWGWKANGGTTSSNTDGNITSTVQSNQDAGFSIVTYTGNGTDNQTIGHGLGVQPNWWLVKRRDSTGGWMFGASSILGGTSNYLALDSTAGNTEINNIWGDSPTSSTLFRVSNNARLNTNNGTYVAYLFADKQGFSKFGQYIGNGNADGPFVYTGFKPAFIMGKRSSTTGDWFIVDNKRDIDNPADKRLFANTTAVESTSTNNEVDLLSNGFKLRRNLIQSNGSGSTYIYMAFAENPFTTSTGIPTTAR